ncbi:MAG: cytochrome c family protein [Hyphomicrobium sp.]|nr:cytochrome c family protein [Hyphomicrobium sp.]MBN9279144.1 cytochrome c family protein [Hyphomicrobium sp.]
MIARLRFPVALMSVSLLGATALAEGNAENGEAVFRRCRTCHEIGPNAKNKVGPHLNGIIGRKAAARDGYAYSPVFKGLGEKGVVWDEATLLKYITKPNDMAPRSKMVFPGLADESERKDLLEYLKKFPE